MYLWNYSTSSWDPMDSLKTLGTAEIARVFSFPGIELYQRELHEDPDTSVQRRELQLLARSDRNRCDVWRLPHAYSLSIALAFFYAHAHPYSLAFAFAFPFAYTFPHSFAYAFAQPFAHTHSDIDPVALSYPRDTDRLSKLLLGPSGNLFLGQYRQPGLE